MNVDAAPKNHLNGSPKADARAATDAFLAAARAAMNGGSMAIVLSKPRPSGGDLKTVRIRPIALRGVPMLCFVWRHATRDVTRNLGIDAGLAAVADLLDAAADPWFAHATLHSSHGGLQLRFSKKGKPTLARTPAEAAAGRTGAGRNDEPAAEPAAHDRIKRRALPLDLPFWVDLGITDARHRLHPSMARKWKQIDKFLEVLDHALDAARLPAGAAPRVVDFGSGKGYLTFAVHEHLRRRYGGAPQVTGVELRRGLVDLCNAAARRSRCEGLLFVEGDLRSHVPQAIDVMIALHACDTATDHAIDLGLRAGAHTLVCSPCCHQELRPQLTSPRRLSGLLRHGIHLGQEAEMVTDSLRALLLEAAGYEAKVFEFVSLEHTSKNKMILATRRTRPADPARALAEVRDIKDFYGIREQCLETLFLRRRDEVRACGTVDARAGVRAAAAAVGTGGAANGCSGNAANACSGNAEDGSSGNAEEGSPSAADPPTGRARS